MYLASIDRGQWVRWIRQFEPLGLPVWVTAPSGVGKSTLLRELSLDAEAEGWLGLALSTVGPEAWAAWVIQASRHSPRALEAWKAAVLASSGSDQQSLAALFPLWASVTPDRPDPERVQQLALNVVQHAVEAGLRGRLLVDNHHALDSASQALVLRLSRLRISGFQLVLTSHQLPDSNWEGASAVLPTLSRTELAEVLARSLEGSGIEYNPSWLQAAWEATGGAPEAAEQWLTRAIESQAATRHEGGSWRLSGRPPRSPRLPWASLAPRERELLEALCAFSHPVTLEWWSRVAQQGVAEADVAAAALRQRGWVHPSGDAWEFSHDLVRTWVEQQLEDHRSLKAEHVLELLRRRWEQSGLPVHQIEAARFAVRFWGSVTSQGAHDNLTLVLQTARLAFQKGQNELAGELYRQAESWGHSLASQDQLNALSAAFASGNRADAWRWSQIYLDPGLPVDERVPGLQYRHRLLMADYRLVEAAELAVEVLNQLSRAKAWSALVRWAMTVLSSVYLGQVETFPAFVSSALRASRRAPLAEREFFRLCGAIVRAWLPEQHRSGYAQGRRALSRAERSGNRAAIAHRTMFHQFLSPLMKPLHSTVEPLRQTYRVALAQGEFDFGYQALSSSLFQEILSTKDLSTTLQHTREQWPHLRQVIHQRFGQAYRRHFQFLLHLADPDAEDGTLALRGPLFDESEAREHLLRQNDRSARFNLAFSRLLLVAWTDRTELLPAVLDEARDLESGYYAQGVMGLYGFYRLVGRVIVGGADPSDADWRARLARLARINPTDYALRAQVYRWFVAEAQLPLDRVLAGAKILRRRLHQECRWPELALVSYHLARRLDSEGRPLLARRARDAAGSDLSRWGALGLAHKSPTPVGASEDLWPLVQRLAPIAEMGQLAVLVLERLLDLAGADGGQLVLPGAGAPGPYRQRRSTVWPGYEWASTDELVAQVTKTQGRVLWRTSTRPRATLGLPFLIRGEVLAVAVLDKDWDEDHFTPTLIAQLETLPPVAAVFLQSALNASQRELWLRQEKLAGLGVLTGVVAHEINNPNHVIAMNSAFLSQQVSRHEPLSQPVRATWLEVLAETRHAAERISALTKDLKSLVRPRLEHRSLALAELLPSWVNTARNTLGGRLRSLTLDLPAGLPVVHGEAERLRQVVLNLIENSVQAGSEAGSEVRVWAIAGPEELRLSVSDDGCGMDEVTRIRALDPFFTTRARQGGTGLGLYLVQTIVTEHGGRVELASQPGKGTTVTVVLPIVGTTLSVL